MKTRYPPKRAIQFLRWFCREDYLEEVEGDLVELFEKKQKQHSRFGDILFFWNILHYLRPSFIKIFPRYTTNNHLLLKHGLLITYRNYVRHKSIFVINVLGLSLGLTSALLIYLWIDDELRVDAFHERKDRLYEVMSNIPVSDTEILTISATPGELGAAMEEEFAEVEEAIMVGRPMGGNGMKGIVSFRNAKVKASELYIDDNFFDIFSFEVLTGNFKRIFPHADAVAVSDELAEKLFGTPHEAMGKSIQWERGSLSGAYVVSGVFAKIPAHSSLQFDIVFPYQKYFSVYNDNLTNWQNSNPHTFVLLREGASPTSLNKKLFDFKKEKIKAASPTADSSHAGTLFIQSYSDRYLYDHFENGHPASGRISYVRLFSVVAVAMLIVVSINFVNLSIARATYRIKEIGVKKTIGVGRDSLFIQFVMESITLSCAAVLIAWLAVFLLLPLFNQFFDKEILLINRPSVFLISGAVAIVTGLLAGVYPALILSSFKPILALRWKATALGQGNTLRRLLVGLQLAVSICLLTGAIVVYHQLQFIRSTNLGYDRFNVLTFQREGKLNEEMETFINRIKTLPGVAGASHFSHDFVGNFGSTSAVDWAGKNPDQRTLFVNLEVGYGLIELLDVKMMAGRTFSQNYEADSKSLILNQAALKVMGLNDPVGDLIRLWGYDYQVIGVVEDFHFESMHEAVKPCFLRLQPKGRNILVKLAPGNHREAISAIQKLYNETNNGLPFEFRFLEDDYNAMYASENRVSILASYFGIVALFVCSLGLFGLTTFVAEQKRKEVAIRKVFGSSMASLIKLLSSEFFAIALVSSGLTLPLCYLLSNSWLSGFTYRPSFESWWVFLPVVLVVAMGLLTISVQTVKAVRRNPIESLKGE